MKLHKFVAIFAATLIGAIASQAHASVISFVERNPDTEINSTTPFTYTFDLASKGFVLGTTNYTSGNLVVRLTDLTGGETGKIMDGPQSTNTGDISNNTVDTSGGTTYSIDLNAAALADLSADGKLVMTISAIDGPGRGNTSVFDFADATLTVSDGSTTSTSVPEPVSVSLLGAGLAGLLVSRRRRKA